MRSRPMRVLAIAATLTFVVTACGPSATPTPASSPTGSAAVSSQAAGSAAPSQGANTGIVGGKLVIDNESGATWTCQLNPYNPSVNGPAIGFIYEELVYVNPLQTNSDGTPKTTPWLASDYAWNADYTQLTFTIRSGVTWTDGQPFTADDVLYTFNAIKADPAMDLNALWQSDGGPLTKVEKQGSDKVVFTFNGAAQTYFYYVADQSPIIPQHIWSKLDQKTLDAAQDTAPIGTGPYLMNACTQDNIQYMRNPNYWQSTPGHPVPQIQEVDYPAFLSNDPANLQLAQGQAQWGAQYIPNIDNYYVAPDPQHRHYWFPPVLNVSVVPNLENALLSKVAVRQAISLAINRADVSKRGESGYEPPANQTGIVLPTYQSWYDQSADTTAFDVAKAGQVLEAAGFTKGSDGIYKDSSGKRLSFTIKTISGYTDWDSSVQVIQQQLKAAGIEISNIIDEDNGTYTTALQKGNFELAYAEQTGGPGPYYELRQMLLGANVGQTNYSRYKSASTDALFNSFAAASPADQLTIIKKIEAVMATDYPVIPVVEGVLWYQYDTTAIGGWPTPEDPYAQPPVW
ncbi:MAG TPA: ABC transporter substrate-binding protein [Candidatus Binatus sp.]|nr:ABC transporter substrate-binding protein [Candidatus Binatus sp.]